MTLSWCVGTAPAGQHWVARLPWYIPACQTAPAQSPLQASIKHPHRGPYTAKQLEKRGNKPLFFFFL